MNFTELLAKNLVDRSLACEELLLPDWRSMCEHARYSYRDDQSHDLRPRCTGDARSVLLEVIALTLHTQGPRFAKEFAPGVGACFAFTTERPSHIYNELREEFLSYGIVGVKFEDALNQVYGTNFTERKIRSDQKPSPSISPQHWILYARNAQDELEQYVKRHSKAELVTIQRITWT
jgi:hypothetical protein